MWGDVLGESWGLGVKERMFVLELGESLVASYLAHSHGAIGRPT